MIILLIQLKLINVYKFQSQEHIISVDTVEYFLLLDICTVVHSLLLDLEKEVF